MNSRDKILFWCLIAVEAAGSQTILWNGIPIYRQLLSPGTEGADTKSFVLATIVVIVMQIAHWAAFRLRPQLQFRRNVLLGYVLVFIGELSLFFVSALAVVILFDRARNSTLPCGKSSFSWRSCSPSAPISINSANSAKVLLKRSQTAWRTRASGASR